MNSDNGMPDIRYQQQLIIAFKLYEMRMQPDSPWNGYGDSDGDWNYAGKVLDHFEDFNRDKNWFQDEEDFDGFRDFLTKGYLEYLQQVKAQEEDSCSD